MAKGLCNIGILPLLTVWLVDVWTKAYLVGAKVCIQAAEQAPSTSPDTMPSNRAVTIVPPSAMRRLVKRAVWLVEGKKSQLRPATTARMHEGLHEHVSQVHHDLFQTWASQTLP